MSVPETATDEASIWAALQIDMTPIFEEAPQDRAFIRELIVAAEYRIAQFCGVHPLEMDPIPPNIAAAIRLDVSIYYFNRLSPVLPLSWDELIAPHRKWGFGGSTDEN